MSGVYWCQFCSARRKEHEVEEDYQGRATCPECGTRVSEQ